MFDNLSELYKKTDSISLAQKFYNEKALLNASMLDSERNVRSVIISHIDAEQQNNLLDDKKNYYKWGAGLAVLFLLIFVGYYFYNRKLNKEYQRFQKVIAQVEKDEKLEAPFSIDDTSLKPSKGIVIPEETEKNILERLEEFEATTKFANSNMNLSLLAKQMKTNSKYISEIIHTHKQKNFNTYINELRVNYIIHLMKTDKAYLNYKVSYLAETCGFSSHSAFTVVFKSITGFTPKQFIAFLKKSKKEKTATF
jgi:AraC-like DNA-binding protein